MKKKDISALENMRQEIFTLSAESNNIHLTDVLAQIANLLRDCTLIIKNPKLKQMDCIVIKSGIHAIGKLKFSTLCDAGIGSAERIEPRHCVPTCPDCVAIILRERK
jgi:hypothetical protein